MPREKFEHDLHRLQDEILALGAMAERAVAESVQTLKDQDFARARSIIEGDRPSMRSVTRSKTRL